MNEKPLLAEIEFAVSRLTEGQRSLLLQAHEDKTGYVGATGWRRKAFQVLQRAGFMTYCNDPCKACGHVEADHHVKLTPIGERAVDVITDLVERNEP